MRFAFCESTVLGEDGDSIRAVVFEFYEVEDPSVITAGVAVRRQAHNLVLVQTHVKTKI